MNQTKTISKNSDAEMNLARSTQVVSAACWMSLSVVGHAAEIDLPIYLRTIAQIETGDNPTKIGRDGERTRWQIRRTEWEQRSSVPFWQADDVEGRRVAALLLSSRIREFEEKHTRPPTPEQVYLLWHRPARVLSPTPAEQKRAERFANLFSVELASEQSKTNQAPASLTTVSKSAPSNDASDESKVSHP